MKMKFSREEVLVVAIVKQENILSLLKALAN